MRAEHKERGVLARTLGLMFCLAAWSAIDARAASDPTKDCAAFPTMKKMKLESVASQMDFNGIPMAIRRFESPEAPEAVLAFYRDKWSAGAAAKAPVEYPLGPWQVIATLKEPCFYTVQVKSFGKGGSEGLLGLSAPPSDKTTVKEDVPMLPGSKLINDIAHNDAGKTARTVLLKNGFSSATNADFYRSNLGDQGWKVLTHHRGGDGADARGDVLVMKKGVREVSIAITQKGSESNVLLNYVDQP